MTFIKGLTGASDMIVKIEEVSEQLPQMQTEIVGEVTAKVVELMKPEFQGMALIIEARVKDTMEEYSKKITKAVGDMASPETVVKAIEKDKRRKRDDKQAEELRKELASIYTEITNNVVVSRNSGKSVSLTKKGSELYGRLSDVITKIAKFHGAKSPNKIANNAMYRKFALEYGIPTPSKFVALLRGGTQRHSVYADLFRSGNVGKFLRYVDRNFLPKEARQPCGE